jgi:hypothetical protein
MPDLKTTGIVVVTLALLLLPSVEATDQSRETVEHEVELPASVNVLLIFRLGTLEDGARKDVKSYQLVVISGGSGSRLLNGARVALATTSRPNDETADAVTFVYQNIGFSTEVNAWMLADGRIKVMASLEDSRIGEELAGKPATIETHQLSVDAILTAGIPLELTRVEGIRDKSGFVEVEATVLR